MFCLFFEFLRLNLVFFLTCNIYLYDGLEVLLMRKRRVKWCLIFCFLILFLMGGMYSLNISKLNITNETSVTSNFDVEIASISKFKNSENVIEVNSFTKDSASFNVQFKKPGDYIYYKIGVTNKGSLPAIAKVGSLKCDNSVILCNAYPESSMSSSIGGNTNLLNSKLVIKSLETEYFILRVSFNSSISSQPDILNYDILFSLVYAQSDDNGNYKVSDGCFSGNVLNDNTLAITGYDKSCGVNVVIPDEINGYVVTQIADGNNNTRDGVFSRMGIESVVFPDSITYIGVNAFTTNKLTSVILPSNLQRIGLYAFHVNNIKSLYTPSSLSVIDGYAFAYNNIGNLVLNDGLKKIGIDAFTGNRLTSVNIPSTVTVLESGSFTHNLVSGEEAFIYGRNSDGTINYSVLNSFAGQSATGTKIPDSVTVLQGEVYVNTPYKDIVVPGRIKNIPAYCFCGTGIESLVIEEGVETISSMAFCGVRFSSLDLPSTIKSIGVKAFDDSVDLMTINIKKKSGSISGSPWGASNATVNWLG